MRIFLLFIIGIMEFNAMWNPNPYTGSHGPFTFWMNEIFSSEYGWVEDRTGLSATQRTWSVERLSEYRRNSYATSRRYFQQFPLVALGIGGGLISMLLITDLFSGSGRLCGELYGRLMGLARIQSYPDPRRNQLRILGTPYLFEYEIRYPYIVTRDQRFDLSWMVQLSRSPVILQLRSGTRLEFVPRTSPGKATNEQSEEEQLQAEADRKLRDKEQREKEKAGGSVPSLWSSRGP